MKILLIVGAVTLSICGSAVAQEMPKYAIEERCKNAERGADFCIGAEQRIYDQLKNVWNGTPAEIRSRCIENGRSSKQESYYWLQTCLESASKPAPKFKY